MCGRMAWITLFAADLCGSDPRFCSAKPCVDELGGAGAGRLETCWRGEVFSPSGEGLGSLTEC